MPKVTRNLKLKIPQGTLIVANHQTWVDPWFIGYFIGFKNSIRVLPLRFPVTSELYRRPILGSLIWIFGGFDIGLTPLERAKGLLYIRQLLEEKYIVIIFPEGKRNPDEDKMEFKKGIHILAQGNNPLLFVKLENMKNLSSFKFWKSNISLIFSEIIESESVDEKTKIIQEFFDLV